MSGFSTYDNWKLASPPEYEEGGEPCCEDWPECDCEERAAEDDADDDGGEP